MGRCGSGGGRGGVTLVDGVKIVRWCGCSTVGVVFFSWHHGNEGRGGGNDGGAVGGGR